MSGWYVSRPARVDADTYFVVEGTDPWNKHALDDGFIGEHARWYLKLQIRHQRVPWNPLRDPFVQISSTRLIHVTPIDRLLGLLVALWATWRLAR